MVIKNATAAVDSAGLSVGSALGGLSDVSIFLRFVSKLLLKDSCYILPDDIEFKVNHGSRLKLVKIGDLPGVGDDGHIERFLLRVDDSEAYAVDRHRPLFDGYVVVLRGLVFEGVVPAAVGFAHRGADRGLVDVTLHHVSVETAVEAGAALEVDLRANGQEAEVTLIECLFDGGNSVFGARNADHREADAVVRHALVDLQFAGE
jgi:hypothetical protein